MLGWIILDNGCMNGWMDGGGAVCECCLTRRAPLCFSLFTLHPLIHFLKASCSSSLSRRPSASSICSAGILEASESCRRGRPETRHASLEGAWQGRHATASQFFRSDGRFFSFSVSPLCSTLSSLCLTSWPTAESSSTT